MGNKALVIPIVVCFAGCMTAGGGDASAPGRNTDGRSASKSPDDARIITSDIRNFWWAYDEATPGNDLRIYRDEYLNSGSVGLKEFVRLKIGSLNNLVFNILKHPRYYASVRSSTLAIHTQEGSIRASFRKLRELHPEALFPDVYFLIGAMNSGGISTDKGLIIGAELFSKTPTSPLDELNPWERSVVQPVNKIPQVVAHELVHFQQHFEKETESLLERSIAEGEADFLAELIAGAQINEPQHRYGDQNEEMVWSEFRDAMSGTDYSRWLYNGGALATKGQPITRPSDLGYYVGYKICQSYYDKANDKKRAVKEMLEIRDFEQFLKDSGYGLTFASRPREANQPGIFVKDMAADTADAIAAGRELASSARIVKTGSH